MPEQDYRLEPKSLKLLLEEARDGHAQLPDFQRIWVWDDSRIRSLLASISRGYPMGAVMLLEAGDDSIQFKQRPLEGAPVPKHKAERLILDGQQRLTALFQSLLSGNAVETRDQRGKQTKRWYYIDMKMALDENADREEAIFSVPENRIEKFRNQIQKDYSKPEYEYRDMVFPLKDIFNSKDWEWGFEDYWEQDEERKEKRQMWKDFDQTIIDKFKHYDVPVIELRKKTPREAVCQVFEKVNTGGVTLTLFDLLTATFTEDNFELRKDWKNRKEQMKEFSIFDRSVLENVSDRDFLQAITLLATRERGSAISCKRSDMLNLKQKEYHQWADPLMKGFERAEFFLHSQYIFDPNFLPYGSQLIPLAAILTVLDRDLNPSEREKLARWYWCGVFGERYGSATETSFANDLPEVVEWVRGGESVPQTVERAEMHDSRLLSLQTRGSAAYKGIYSLFLREGAHDLITGDAVNIQHYFERSVDIHHIFPKKWCETMKLEKKRWNSIVNKTPLTSRTNRKIGPNAPSKYTAGIEHEQGMTAGALNDLLLSHFINPEHLRNDDFTRFFEERSQKLIGQIEKLTGKIVVRDSIDEAEEDDIDEDYVDEDE